MLWCDILSNWNPCKNRKLLSEIEKNHIWYFVLTPIWVYMIYCGSMEITVRNYGSYG